MLQQYLEPTYFIDSDSEEVRAFCRKTVAGLDNENDRAVKIFYAVRDGIIYDPYCANAEKKDYRASTVLKNGRGFCVQKAIVMAAAVRAAGIPCRLLFANVRNHLITEKLRSLMGTDLFVFHGYNEVYLQGKWVKATPTFNISLCEKFGVYPLEFDGIKDAVLHPFDKEGKKHMEYVHDYGHFHDFPLAMMLDEVGKFYPHLLELIRKNDGSFSGNFEKEAEDVAGNENNA